MQKFKDQYAIKDDIHAPNGDLKIKFVGVWDTVSALGFSQDFSFLLKWIFSAADKISNMIPWLAHDFYDYDLNNSIENAYHALSIDDERTTFHPKVWDEKAVWTRKKLNRSPLMVCGASMVCRGAFQCRRRLSKNRIIRCCFAVDADESSSPWPCTLS